MLPSSSSAAAPEPTTTARIDGYLFGPFRLDTASLQLWRGDVLVPLPPKAFDTLLVLISHRQRLVTKDELLAAVWPNSFVAEESVAQNITSLRRALVDDHTNPTYIATIARRGYRFIGSVTEQTAAQPAAAVEVLPPPASPVAAPSVPSAAPAPRINYWPFAAVTIAVLLLVAFLANVLLNRRGDVAAPLQLSAEAPAGEKFVTGVFSPIGADLLVVTEAAESRTTRLAVRALAPDRSQLRLIPGSDGAARPFWSPDGQMIGFFAQGRLKRVGVDGGTVQTVASIVGPQGSGGSWGANNQILFANYMSGIFVVDAAGGEPRALTRIDPSRQEVAHRWPQWLPNGRQFLYSVISGNQDHAGTFIASIDDPNSATRVTDAQGAVFVAPATLVYVRDRVLLAQRFNADSGELSGTPVTIAGDAQAPIITNSATISASPTGLLAFSGYHNRAQQLAWVTRGGEMLRRVKTPADLYNPSMSNDERLLVAGTGRELWLIDLDRDAATRLGSGNTTAFSPDGLRLAYTSGPAGAGMSELYVREAAGSATARLLLGSHGNKIVTDWSRDGRFIIYCSVNEKTQQDIWAMPTMAADATPAGGGATPISVLASPANECQGRLSPDGRWLAYTSDETGAFEVYVQAFAGNGSKRVVSIGGGAEPQWRSDGRELFYLAADGTLMSVAMGAGERAAIPKPAALFRIPLGTGELNTRRNHYLASADGQRFLVNSSDQPDETLNVLVNWPALTAAF